MYITNAVFFYSFLVCGSQSGIHTFMGFLGFNLLGVYCVLVGAAWIYGMLHALDAALIQPVLP